MAGVAIAANAACQYQCGGDDLHRRERFPIVRPRSHGSPALHCDAASKQRNTAGDPSIISCHRILRPRGNWPTKPTAEQTWTLCPRKSAARLTMNSPSPRPSERVASARRKALKPSPSSSLCLRSGRQADSTTANRPLPPCPTRPRSDGTCGLFARHPFRVRRAVLRFLSLGKQYLRLRLGISEALRQLNRAC